ncbi:hypothetical protein [Chitinolyticbacter albus]|uniref:hypothetical protein n=1 Tax=Chitinolyticbacter albus TaxID=2961951 RepID=UPI00210CB0D9|nr:hypothetical protein [Chitinolyticbacter albus]
MEEEKRTGKGIRILPKRLSDEKIQNKIDKTITAQGQLDDNQNRLHQAMRDSMSSRNRNLSDAQKYHGLAKTAETSKQREQYKDEADKHERFAAGWYNEARQYYSYFKKYGNLSNEEKGQRAYFPQVQLSNQTEGKLRYPDLLKVVNKNGLQHNSFVEFKTTRPEMDQQQAVYRMLDKSATRVQAGGQSSTVQNLGTIKNYKIAFSSAPGISQTQRTDITNEHKSTPDRMPLAVPLSIKQIPTKR